jgi:endonuclease/exonuclease/phosphatase (EEP) superfamily protein YafD
MAKKLKKGTQWMKTWFLIVLFYLIVGYELFSDDSAIATRYLHFAYLPYFVLSCLFFIYLLIFHFKKTHWFLPAFAFISYSFITPLFGYFSPPHTQNPTTIVTKLKLLSFSVNSRNQDYQQVAQLLKKNPADVICLQEIPYNRYALFLEALKKEKLNYQHNYSKLSSSMLLTKQKITPNATVPYQKATLTLADQTIRIWNIHSPKSLHRKHYQGKFMRMLAKDVSNDKIAHKLICGDFNATPHNTFIRPFFNTMQPAFYAANNRLNFTYPTDKTRIPTPIPFLKIDYLFLSDTMKATHYQRLTDHANSDHYPITAQVNVYASQMP